MKDNLHVLIVDDDEGMTTTLKDILEFKDYFVEVANSGHEAIEKVKESVFDCIFMDILMPGMDGVEAFKRIKQHVPDCLVVMMTAYALQDLIEEAKREGALTVIKKPVDPARLVEMLETIKLGSSVIVVDEDEEFCKTLCHLLESKGCSIAFTKSGKEAIDLVQQSMFDFIILNAAFLHDTEVDVLGAVRKFNPSIAVILLSGDEAEELELAAEQLDTSYAVLKKPYAMDKVLEILQVVRRKKLIDTL